MIAIRPLTKFSLYKLISAQTTKIQRPTCIKAVISFADKRPTVTYSFTFPNLKCLALYYFSVTWKAESGEFRAIIPRYSLKKLEIDLTPVKTKSIKYLTAQNVEEYFSVIQLETLSDNERRLFKVSLDLSSITRIVDGDIKKYNRGEDYFKVFISIQSLERLELCMGNNGDENYRYLSDDSQKPVARTTVVI